MNGVLTSVAGHAESRHILLAATVQVRFLDLAEPGHGDRDGSRSSRPDAMRERRELLAPETAAEMGQREYGGGFSLWANRSQLHPVGVLFGGSSPRVRGTGSVGSRG